MRTVMAAHAVDPGFDADGLVMAEVELYGARGRRRASGRRVVRQTLAQLQQRPEIEQAAAAALMPLTIFRKPGRIRDASGEQHSGLLEHGQ